MRHDDVPEAIYGVIPAAVRSAARANALQWRAYEVALRAWSLLPRRERRLRAMPCPPDGIKGAIGTPHSRGF